MNKTFQSKRDRWLTIVIWIAVVSILAAVVNLMLASRWLVAASLVAASGGMLWVFYGTRYTVTDKDLIVRSGPLAWRIPLQSITSVKPSRDPASSPASSLDRLEIRYASNKRILVSPADRPAFLAELPLSEAPVTDDGPVCRA